LLSYTKQFPLLQPSQKLPASHTQSSVFAPIRGGGEFGPQWHEAGRREGKALCHDDFAAVAADLVSWKSRVIGFGHAEQDIGDADRAEYR